MTQNEVKQYFTPQYLFVAERLGKVKVCCNFMRYSHYFARLYKVEPTN